MTLPALRNNLIGVSLLGLVCATVLFLSYPQIDLIVSGFFAGPGARGFPISQQPIWQDVRGFFILTTDGTILLLLLLLIHNLIRPRRALGSQRQIGFVVLAYALGPGLLVNGILKSWWGRARPRQVVEFGGTHLFTAPVLPADQCTRNCSFVSGEASSVAAIALSLLLVFWPRLGTPGRIAASLTAVIYVAMASGLRIAFGGHFLSDTIFAVLLMGVLVPILRIG